ncbi:OmpA family protein [Bacteroidota bacterium]
MTAIKRIILLLFIISPIYLPAQFPDGQIEDYYVTEDLDTVMLSRRHGPFWFGAMAGGNFNLDMGEVKFLRKPFEPPSDTLPSNTLIPYTPDMGGGYFMGVLADWQPAGSYFGGSLRAYVLDNWTSTAYSEVYSDTIKSEFDNTTEFTYLTISPSGRYNFHPNFHVFAGADIGLNLAYTSVLKRKHVYTGDIKHDYSYEKFNMNMRFGGHIGVAGEVVILDVNQRMRLILSPFISIHAGTAMISDNESNWNTITLRGGISLKLGPDEIVYDTLPYVPSPEPPPVILASLDRKSNIAFPGFSLESFVIRGEMAAVDRSLVEDEYRIETVVSQNVVSKPEILKAIAERADIALAGSNRPKEKTGEKIVQEKLVTNVDKSFGFTSSASTEISRDIRKYLDNVAVYMKENPAAVLGITGHSDDQGTFLQNDSRARNRAKAVADYLVKKGIRRSRLLANGKGSIEPIASNKTAAGRKKNRRVEIRIVPSAKDLRKKR